MKQHYFLLLLLLTVSTAHAQIDLGENNVRYLTAPMGGAGYCSPKFSPDGKYLAVLSESSLIYVFDVESGLYFVASDSTIKPDEFVWSPDGKTMIASETRSTYDSSSGKTKYTSVLHYINVFTAEVEKTKQVGDTTTLPQKLYIIRFIEDGKYLFAVYRPKSGEYHLVYLNPISGEIIKNSPTAVLTVGISNVSFDEFNKRVILFTRQRGWVEVFDMENLNSIKKIFTVDSSLGSIAFVPKSNNVIITSSFGGAIKPRFYLVDISSGETIKTFAGMQGGISSIAVTNDGKYVITAGSINGPFYPTTIGLWDINSGEMIRTWSSAFSSMAMPKHPNQQYVASAARFSDSICLWPIPQITTGVVTGMQDIQKGKVVCRPNPANDEVEIRWQRSTKDRGRISIMNLLGEEVGVVYEGTEAMGERRVDTSGLSNGQYMIVLRDGEKSWVEPLVIAR